MNNKEYNTNTEMQEKQKGKKKLHFNWISSGICISLLVAILFTSLYGIFEKQANANMNNPLEDGNNLTYLYQNCYVLYRDLYNKQNQTSLSFSELYLEFMENYEKLKDKQIRQSAMEGYDETEITNRITQETIRDIDEVIEYLDNHFETLESSFGQMNAIYDFVIQDNNTYEYITNQATPNLLLDEQFFYISFSFDEFGNVTVGSDVLGNDPTRIRKNANEIIRNCTISNLLHTNTRYELSDYGKYIKAVMPKNCTVQFCISRLNWQQLRESSYEDAYELYNDLGNGVYISHILSDYSYYNQTNCGEIYLILLLVVFCAGLFIPKVAENHPWKNQKICRLPIEGLLIIVWVIISMGSSVVNLVKWVAGNVGVSELIVHIPYFYANIIVYTLNLLALSILFFGAWYVGICMRGLTELGLKKYIKLRWYAYRIFPYCKEKAINVYHAVEHFDVTQSAHKLIIKIVLVNAVILFVISSLWVGGLAVALVYSIFLYFILRKYISNLQKKYSILLKATNEIAQGNLNVTITEDLGVFEQFKPQIFRIQDGFKNAVEEEIKSQRMKSELITNVSHDLKTPLTAIITYIDLLQQEDVTEEQRKEYLQTLERKSLRLKVLIEDLFEVSKASSKNITLNIVDVDIVNLIKQVYFEMTDKLANAKLDVRIKLPEEKIILPLDSQKTYRIFENLLGNIAKYALPGTRVYIDGIITEENITITLKNITAEELFVSAEELTERFVRGDASRNTEGSGLGLAIAKSFTELQNGTFDIQLDGDLFKVTLVWNRVK